MDVGWALREWTVVLTRNRTGGGRPVKTEAEVRAALSQAKKSWGHQKLEGARKDSALEPLVGT